MHSALRTRMSTWTWMRMRISASIRMPIRVCLRRGVGALAHMSLIFRRGAPLTHLVSSYRIASRLLPLASASRLHPHPHPHRRGCDVAVPVSPTHAAAYRPVVLVSRCAASCVLLPPPPHHHHHHSTPHCARRLADSGAQSLDWMLQSTGFCSAVVVYFAESRAQARFSLRVLTPQCCRRRALTHARAARPRARVSYTRSPDYFNGEPLVHGRAPRASLIDPAAAEQSSPEQRSSRK